MGHQGKWKSFFMANNPRKTHEKFYLQSRETKMSSKYYYLHDIARLFNVSYQSVSNMIKRGAVPTPVIVKENHLRVRRWNKSEIDEFLKELESEE